MKIYLSSLPINLIIKLHELNPFLQPNVLISFDGLTKSKQIEYEQTYRDMFGGLILDSGAFGLNMKKHRGQLTEEDYEIEATQLYLDYIDRLQDHKSEYDFYISMDDRFDSAGFLHNRERYNEMLEVGLDPVPVIHTLDPDSEEVKYWINLKDKPKMVAIGQCDEYPTRKPNDLRKVAEKLYEAEMKPYFLGITNCMSLARIPVHSCDSKSWLNYGSIGQVLYWNPKSKMTDKTEKLYFPEYEGQKIKGNLYHSYKHRGDFERYIGEKLGFTMDDLLGLKKGQNRLLVNIVYFIELERQINAIHENMDIVFDDE